MGAIIPTWPEASTSWPISTEKTATTCGAEPLYQRALAIWEKALDPGDPEVVKSLVSLALLYRMKGDDKHADPFHVRAKAIRVQWWRLGVASKLNNLALLDNTNSEYEYALSVPFSAIRSLEKSAGPDVLSNCYIRLATLYQKAGNDVGAGLFYERALGILEKTPGRNHPHVAATAMRHAAEGNISVAIDWAEIVYESQEHFINDILLSSSEEQKRAYFATLSGDTDIAISLHLREAPDNLKAARFALTTLSWGSCATGRTWRSRAQLYP